MSTVSVEFENQRGSKLSGLLEMPAQKPRAAALFAHCFTCTAQSNASVRISRALARHGIAVLRFDFTSLGASAGGFANRNFSTSVEDILAAASFLENLELHADLLIGHSLGGTAVLAAAESLPQCRALVTIAAPARAEHIGRLIASSAEEIEARGTATVDIGGRPFEIGKQFLDDLRRVPTAARLRELRCALLVMHGPRDTVVDIENAAEIFRHALHPKSFVTLDDADHLLTRNEDAEYAADVIAAWSRRYLGTAAIGPSSPRGWVTAETAAEGLATSIGGTDFELLADEPLAKGGTNLGPSPYDLLSAALASCTSMTLQIYARRKGLSLDSVKAHVRHEKIHAEDCAGCESKLGRIDRFERELECSGELDAAARKRLLEIADRCPVHKTLRGEVRIVTRERGD